MKNLYLSSFSIFLLFQFTFAQNVGIGNSIPDAPLTIGDGTSPAGYLHIKRANNPHINLFEGTTSMARIQGDLTNGHPQFQIVKSNGVSPMFVVNQDDGRVGIGTTDPFANLHINEVSPINETTIGRFTAPTMTNGQALFLKIGRNDATNNMADIVYKHQGNNSGSNYLGFGFHGTEIRMFVRADGNVGIGLPDPTQKLDINGKTLIRGGGTSFSTTGTQVLFGFGGTASYQHAIKTRHQSTQAANNAIDFYVWNYGTDAVGAEPTKRVMTIDGGGDGRIYMSNETKIQPRPGGNYARIGSSDNAMQDVYTRFSFVNTAYSFSDRNLKKEIMPVSDRIHAIDALMSIQPKAFKWKLNKLYWEDAKAVTSADTTWRYGFIAQDIEAAMPETVHRMKDSGTLAINYDAIVSVLFEATRQQQGIIESQQSNQKKLEEQIRTLLFRVEELENK